MGSTNNTAGSFGLPAGYGAILDAVEDTPQKPDRIRKEISGKSFSPVVFNRENYDNYLFRCHNFGRMMGGVPKALTTNQAETYAAYKARYMGDGKPLTAKQELTFFDLGAKLRAQPELSSGAISLCEEIVREDLFGRRNIIDTQYMDKGLECEDDAIALYSEFRGILYTKNNERKKNQYFQGECDILDLTEVIDIKTSWDFTTFPVAAQEIKTAMYEWQLQLYMDLYERENARLVYCLVDTPIRLVEDQIRRLDWKYDIMTFEGSIKEKAKELVIETVCNMIYTVDGLIDLCNHSGTLEIGWFDGVFKELPIERRIKEFKLKRDESMLNNARKMVALGREYMNQSLLKLK